MRIQKLVWAGIIVEAENSRIVIDPLFTLDPAWGIPREPIFPLTEYGPVDAVLVTHLHTDHFDPKAIVTFYGKDIPVYMPEQVIYEAKQTELTAIYGAMIGRSFTIGALTVTPTYAVDGIGDMQLGYVVEDSNNRILHNGDTLWHGYWWKMKQIFGPFDAVFLPVNAPLIDIPGVIPSAQPVVMSPEQAVSAAVILEAKRLIPIHYGTFNNPPHYTETADVLSRLEASARNKVKLSIMQVKEELVLM